MARSMSMKSGGGRKGGMKEKFRVCFCFRWKYSLNAGEAPAEVKEVFDKYSTKGTMSVEELAGFLKEFQREETSDDGDDDHNEAIKKEAQSIYESVKHLSLFHRRGLHFDAFFRYLLGEGHHNGPLRPPKQHMNAPLAHYFMYTGHNSYLTGNQFTSDSSTLPIISALKNGVRVIELDLWPNPRADDAEVRHGGTLTAPVALRECLEAIREHAFDSSEYPVVITFENHLKIPRLQTKVAKMVRGIFGQMLYCLDSINSEQTHFPSPESLKRRVMISTKPPEYREKMVSQPIHSF